MVVNLADGVKAEVEVVEEVVEVSIESDMMSSVLSKLWRLHALEAEVVAKTVSDHDSRPKLHFVVRLVAVEMMVWVTTVGCPVFELL